MAEKEHFGDIVIDKLFKRHELVKRALHTKFKHTKPFRMKPMTDDELLDEYERTTPEQMNEYIEQFGVDFMGEKIAELEKLKVKRGGI